MKKIMFSDKYDLTRAVLEGRKTQTRRIITIPKNIQRQIVGEPKITGAKDYRLGVEVRIYDEEDYDFVPMYVQPVYLVNEIVAIARSYKDMSYGALWDDCLEFEGVEPTKLAGWNNKMFVRADYMLHRIRITKVRIQRLQDISDVDCMAEGINYYEQEGFSWCSTGELFDTPREAYAALIDKISGKGTWESNPYVWVYEFELVKWI
ncbi:hypothetical protein [Paraprevotella clara]|jgi:hypothetical protein|uniref:hypothetical protein n=1 Tax=Paraprevotella clara TaxID=454154 RepID=UPI00307B56FB